MTTVVRYPWMFRAAAVVYLLLGASMAWRFGLTGYDPAHRAWGVAIGVLAIVAISAAVAAPIVHGPVILAFGAIAIVFGLYAALAGRVLLQR